MTSQRNETPEPLVQEQAGEYRSLYELSGCIADVNTMLIGRNELKSKDAEIAEWRKLLDSSVLHANLLRGLPAQLTREQLLHLLGDDAEIARLKADAGRYRWLLAKHSSCKAGDEMNPAVARVDFTRYYPGSIGVRPDLGDAIDAAIRAQTGGEHD